MKVVLVNTLYAPNAVGGAEKSVQQLAESLLERGHRPVVVSLSWDGGRRDDQINGVRSLYLPIRNLYFPFVQPGYGKYVKPVWHLIDSRNRGVYKEMREIIDETQPDIVHTNNLLGFSTSVWRAAEQRGVPVVHTLRDYYLLCPRQTMFKKGKRCTRTCLSCLPYAAIRCADLGRVKALVGVSQRILDIHLKEVQHAAPALATHIYNGVNEQVHTLKHEERTGPTPFTVGFLGRISEEKGLTNLLEALGVHAALENEVRLVVGGRVTNEDAARYKKMAGRADVEFLGFTSPANVLSRVNYLIVPSLWEEPFSRVVIEAYAHGVPVIASRRGGMTEIVREGETGYLFDPDVAGSLASVLNTAMNGMRRFGEMRNACIAYARSFSASSVVEGYLDIYRKIMEGAGREWSE